MKIVGSGARSASGSVPKYHGSLYLYLDCVGCRCRDRIPCRSSCRPPSGRRSSSFSPSRRAARGEYSFSAFSGAFSSRNLAQAFVEISWSSSLDRHVPVHIWWVLIDYVVPSVVDPDRVKSASFRRIRIGTQWQAYEKNDELLILSSTKFQYAVQNT